MGTSGLLTYGSRHPSEHLFQENQSDLVNTGLESIMRHKVMKIFLVTVILSTIALFGETSQAEASHTNWVDRALNLQEDIDRDAPFSQALWIGTHNSFNAREDGYGLDPNQALSVTNQLRAGARYIVFDVHRVFRGYFLCHAGGDHVGCDIISDRRFGAGLRDIQDYALNHPQDVIVLKIETFLSNRHSRFANKLNDVLGPQGADILYRPPIQSEVGAGQGEVCQFIDQAKLTKGTMLAAGKNVIVSTGV